MLQFKKVNIYTYTLFLLIPILIGCKINEKEEPGLTINCAAGLSDYILEVKDSLKKKGMNPVINIASSGTLARQIEQGFHSDIFISANKKWAEYINSIVSVDTLIPFCQNKLALIAPLKHKIKKIDDLLLAKKIALGNPGYVPAGEYTREALITLGLYNSLEEKCIYTKDVKAALRLVELSECDAGFVYYSDALKSTKIKIIKVIPDSLHTPIIFYLLKRSNNSNEIFNYLVSEESAHILKSFGLYPISLN